MRLILLGLLGYWSVSWYEFSTYVGVLARICENTFSEERLAKVFSPNTVDHIPLSCPFRILRWERFVSVCSCPKDLLGSSSLVIQRTEHRLCEEHGSRWQHTVGYIEDTSQDPGAEMLVDHRECSEHFRALVPLPQRCLFFACLCRHLLAGQLPWRLAENVSPSMPTHTSPCRQIQPGVWVAGVGLEGQHELLILGWAHIQSLWRPPGCLLWQGHCAFYLDAWPFVCLSWLP